jgi:hypothetical protein
MDSSAVVQAIGEGDAAALNRLVAEHVTFNSPIRTYHGRDDVVHLLTTIGSLLDELSVTRELAGPGETAAFIAGCFDEHGLDGVLDQRRDEQGRVVELTLMLRPLSALLAAVKRMSAALEEAPLPSRA